MRTTHFFNGELSIENVSELIRIIESEDSDFVSIYFSSNGGNTSAALVLIDYINNNSDKIELIGHWGILSCALDVFTYTTCKKRILKDAHGMIHVSSRDVDTFDMLSNNSYGKILWDINNDNNNKMIERLSDFLNKEEINRIKNGDNIYLNHERLIKYLKKYSSVQVKIK